MNFHFLRAAIEKEIDGYVYEHPKECLGSRLPDEWVKSQLDEMRLALVEPKLVEVAIQDMLEQLQGKAPPIIRQCVLVADDREGYELYLDPTDGNYVLAYSGNPPTTFIRGDAVGCFMAR